MWINNAYAQFGGSGADSGLSSIIMMVGMFGVLWFVMIRPQMKRQKEHKALLAALAKGDEVICAGGLLGKVTEVMAPPNLMELQTRSYWKFLQADVPADEREDSGLERILRGEGVLHIATAGSVQTVRDAYDSGLSGLLRDARPADGADAARFTIDAATGALSFVAAPDFEAPADANGDNVYDVIVQVSDGTLTDTQAIAVTVTPVNDNNPVFTSGAAGNAAHLSL